MSTIDYTDHRYTDHTGGTAPERSFHPVHIGHLVMGLAFLGLVGIWAAVEYDVVPTDDVRWLLPLPWVFAGVAGLLAVLFSGRGRAVPPVAPAPMAAEPVAAEPQESGSPLLDLLDDHVEPHENEEIR